MKICVIVLNYMSYQETISYAQALKLQQPASVDIVIVDNNSPNDSLEKLLETFEWDTKVTVIDSGRNGGYAFGNNVGLEHIESKNYTHVVISNNDVTLESTTILHDMAEQISSIENVAFAAPVMLSGTAISSTAATRLPNLWDDLIGSVRLTNWLSKRTYTISRSSGPMAVDCLPGSFFIGKKSTFFDLGLFDENTFLYMEEAILAIKAKKHGLQNYLLTDLSFLHEDSKTISSVFSSIEMRSFLIESRVYFHRVYLKTGPLGLAAIKVLAKIWELETKIIGLFPR